MIGETDKTGTEIHFVPDPEIFTETVEFQYDVLAERTQELAFLNKGIMMTIEDKRENGRSEHFIMKVEFNHLFSI